ncbi:MAG: hypothetical protein LBM12_02045 [Candidatus Nomurabacteria bacterium]|jgi:hypothetical protein|nr:hypothetical protein [Candidatus Nomurabacteria bacterium]
MTNNLITDLLVYAVLQLDEYTKGDAFFNHKPREKLNETILRTVFDTDSRDFVIRSLPLRDFDLYSILSTKMKPYANTLGNLLSRYDRKELRALRGIGRTTYTEIVTLVYALGLRFSGDSDDDILNFIEKLGATTWEEKQRRYVECLMFTLRHQKRAKTC